MKTKLIIIAGGKTSTVCPFCHNINIYIKGDKVVCCKCGVTYEV